MKKVKTQNAGYNSLAEKNIQKNCKNYGMSYEKLMEHIEKTICNHAVIQKAIKLNIVKIEVIDTHVYILFKSNYKYKGMAIGDVISNITNSLFYNMTLSWYADTINNKNIMGWCKYDKFTFISPSMFTPLKPYKRVHTRQQIKTLYK